MTTDFVTTNQQLAKLLERQNLFPTTVLDGLTGRARTLQEWLGQVAVDDGLLTYEELALAISRELQLPMLDVKTILADPLVVAKVPEETCRTYGCLPVRTEGAVLIVAMANPMDEVAHATLRNLIGMEVSPVVAPLSDIVASINKAYIPQQTVAKTPAQREDDRAMAAFFTNTQQITAPLDPSTMDPNELSIDQLLFHMLEHRSSDLHLAVGSPPMMRVDGELLPMPFPMLTPSSVQIMIYAVLSDVQITDFERHWELDFAYSIPRVSRFRVNVHRQRGSMGAVMRTIPDEMPTLDKLKMPHVVFEMTERPRGLVLVTGPTGSGKSTTLAAMIDEINRTRRSHIVTIEDPIEFLHRNKMSVVTQREVGSDTEGFTTALRHVLRQDPDVILIGEMRDLETIAAAVTAAETGHLVFATLHTTSAAQTIERIIDVFPPHQQEQIRSQLSNTLEGILTQTLIPNLDGKGRSCAQEILICTPAIRNLIREGKVHQMSSVLQASAKYGMQTLDNALKQLVLQKRISLEQAILKSSNPEDFKALLAMQ
ncbi:MAG TPA: PilT/PilU family type 4a pilus ATPase [Armatimonadota bacterium]|jgi:twitching motility protein PilT